MIVDVSVVDQRACTFQNHVMILNADLVFTYVSEKEVVVEDGCQEE